jgi:hypothetical protein
MNQYWPAYLQQQQCKSSSPNVFSLKPRGEAVCLLSSRAWSFFFFFCFFGVFYNQGVLVDGERVIRDVGKVFHNGR